LGLDEVLTTPYCKNGLVTCAQACTDPIVQPKQWKKDMRFGT